jgi:transglutaminase-like putative cysteine protease
VTRDDRRAAGAAAGATLLGSAALLPVFTTTAWLRPVLSVVLAVWAGGLLLRTGGPRLWQRAVPGRRVPRVLEALGTFAVPVAQLGLVLCVLTVFYAPDDAFWRIGPTTTSVGDLAAVLLEGSAELREQATPALPLTGLVALTTLLVAVVAVAVDLIAVAGRQAALAGLGLLGLYCVPVGTVTGSIGLAAVAAPAAGFALLLWADQRRRLAAGGRPLVRAVTDGGSRAALRVGVLALLTGLVVGSVVPTTREGSFGTGLGGGTGGGGTIGTALDPVAALQGQLRRPEPLDLLSMAADVEDPGYLRAVVLDQYDPGTGWVMSNLDGELSVEQQQLAPLPPDVSRRPVEAEITAREHDDRFLPVLWSPQSVTLDDTADWRFDPTTSTVFGRDTTTAGRSWTVRTEQPVPSRAVLDASPELDPADPLRAQFTGLPELDPSVPALVAELTDGAQTPYQRVRRILDYLTDRENGFVYSLSTAPGTSGDDLVDFLRLKAGYCEQYAGAMAVLVRAAQVPARVALGYTPGQVQSDGTRLITTDDAHAWVEVYFAGLGWVPFDPTPISETRAVDLPWAPRASDDRDDAAGDSPATAAPQAAPIPRTDRADGAIQALSPTTDDSGWVGTALVAAGTALLLGAVLAVPATLRVLQRRRRLAAGAPGDLWDELTATVTDLGIPRDPAWTPRQTAAHLARSAGHGGDPIAADRAEKAVRRLALAEEAASYGPGREVGPERDTTLREALDVARRGLTRAVPRWTRLRALLWPTTLVTAVASAAADRVRRLGRLVRAPRRSRPA